LQVLTGHEGAVMGVSFARDGQQVASAGADGTVRVWDVRSGREVSCFEGHDGPVGEVRFGPNRRLLSGGHDGTVRLWEAPP
jgi:WD40 repeat protein